MEDQLKCLTPPSCSLEPVWVSIFHHLISVTQFLLLNFHHSSLITHNSSLIFSHSFGNITFIFITQFFHTIHGSHTCQPVQFFFFFFSVPKLTEVNIKKKKKYKQPTPTQREREKKKKKKQKNKNCTANPRPKKKEQTANANPGKKKKSVKKWSKVAAMGPLCVFNYNIVIQL